MTKEKYDSMKKALEHCRNHNCMNCKYYAIKANDKDCISYMIADALNVLDDLEIDYDIKFPKYEVGDVLQSDISDSNFISKYIVLNIRYDKCYKYDVLYLLWNMDTTNSAYDVSGLSTLSENELAKDMRRIGHCDISLFTDLITK